MCDLIAQVAKAETEEEIVETKPAGLAFLDIASAPEQSQGWDGEHSAD